MAKITIIAAIGKNFELGKNNDLIWYLKEDLKFFKENTMGHKIVMGLNTFNSLPKLLPGRDHIILSHQNITIDGTTIFNNFEELKNYLESLNEEVFIIGGASIYKLFIEYADKLILTEIEDTCLDADVYFPTFNKENYEKEEIKTITENNLTYKHVIYRRVK